jgi:hypothetical protein
MVYRVGPYVGDSIASYRLPEAGTYVISLPDDAEEINADDRPAAPPDPLVFAVGHVPVELLKSGFFGVYGGAVTLGLCFSAAVILGLITWARRHPPAHLRQSRPKQSAATSPAASTA